MVSHSEEIYLLKIVDICGGFSSQAELGVSGTFGRHSEALGVVTRRDQRDYSLSQTTTIFFKTRRLAHPDLRLAQELGLCVDPTFPALFRRSRLGQRLSTRSFADLQIWGT